MSRSLVIQPKEGFLPWRAHPGAETTMSELEAAISMLKLDILRTTDDEILLVQTAEAIREGVPPPNMEELGRTMFGEGHNAILVTETGQHRTLDLEADGELDASSAEEFSVPADLQAEGQLFEAEARDRHFEQDADLDMGLGSLPFSLEPLDVTIDLEEDADREMIGDDVDLGIENIGNK